MFGICLFLSIFIELSPVRFEGEGIAVQILPDQKIKHYLTELVKIVMLFTIFMTVLSIIETKATFETKPLFPIFYKQSFLKRMSLLANFCTTNVGLVDVL